MARQKSATEQLAALVVATGVLCITSPAVNAAGDGIQSNSTGAADSLKAVDRTPYRLVHGGGKASGCGKCGANSCGMSYWDKMHSKQHGQKRVIKHNSKKSAKKNNKR